MKSSKDTYGKRAADAEADPSYLRTRDFNDAAKFMRNSKDTYGKRAADPSYLRTRDFNDAAKFMKNSKDTYGKRAADADAEAIYLVALAEPEPVDAEVEPNYGYDVRRFI